MCCERLKTKSQVAYEFKSGSYDAGADAPGARCNFDFGTCKPNGPGNPTICEACGYAAVDGTPIPCCPGMPTSPNSF